ncbi:MAG TPA: hypothetical protein VEL76_38660 [Gemmataceae bacterium]|nr:hypothetical protein [Gemmataceae bacterium]
MTDVIEQPALAVPSDTDLVAAVRRVLENSSEPLTLSKIRVLLPASFRSLSLEALSDVLQRQVAANVLVQYPRYRSPQDRFWDRPMRVHVVQLLQAALSEQPLAVSELRRKLPDYAKTQAEAILEEEVAAGALHRHPPANSRSGPRFSAEPANPKTFLRNELPTLFSRLEKLGFSQAQLRQAALELLHEEEWATPAQQVAGDGWRVVGEEEASMSSPATRHPSPATHNSATT